MKKIVFVVCMLLIAILLKADFSNPIIINTYDFLIENISDQAIKSYEGSTYVVYKQHFRQIMCSRVTPSGDVITTEVFSEDFVLIS